MNPRKITISFILALLLLLALIGLFFFMNLGISAANSYLFLGLLFIFFISIPTIAFYFGKQEFWYDIAPISDEPDRGMFMMLLGILVVSVLLMFSFFTGSNFYSPFFFAPLGFKGLLSAGSESFAALSAATSATGEFFVVGIVAPVIEEMVLGLGAMMIFSFVLGYGLRKIFKWDFGDTGNNVFDFSLGLIGSIILFSSLHIFNGTYLNADGSLNMKFFMFAATFRFVLNIFIYLFDFGILFGIGAHMMNNMLFLGGVKILGALISPVGVIFDAIIVLFLFFAVTSLPQLIRDGNSILKINLFKPTV